MPEQSDPSTTPTPARASGALDRSADPVPPDLEAGAALAGSISGASPEGAPPRAPAEPPDDEAARTSRGDAR
jgi:hypothetical protein